MKYVKPSMETVKYDLEDILTASSGGGVTLVINALGEDLGLIGDSKGDTDSFQNLFDM